MMMIHRTLIKLTFGATIQPSTMEISMISADLSWKELGPSGASVLAAFLPKCTYVPYTHAYIPFGYSNLIFLIPSLTSGR
jgi:hypothetical protein